LWTAISDFIREFIGIFYQSDDDVAKDYEIQSWVREIHDDGLPVREGDVDHEFPDSLQTRDQLVHMLVCVVFTCSCQHAAVNFSQLESAFIPNVPPVMRLPAPTRKNQATLELIMDTLPNKSQAGWHIATMYALTRVSEDEVICENHSKKLQGNIEQESYNSKSLGAVVLFKARFSYKPRISENFDFSFATFW